jgi:RNase P/RNase MRP subunit POP5
MKKIKLKPSLREKKHYLLITTDSKEINLEDIKERVKKAILQFIGTLGYSKAGIVFVNSREKEISDILEKNKMLILASNTDYVDHIKSSLILYKDSENIELKCIRVSGTLKKLKEFIEEVNEIK